MKNTKPRQCNDWIEAYLKYTYDNEYPRSFHLWNAICCISGAMQRRLCMPWGAEDIIYPNLFVVLVGHSGLGKGRSMKPAISIFKETGLPVSPASITIEQLLVHMAKHNDVFMHRITKKPISHTSMQIFAEELSVLLGQRNIKKLSILTDLFDSHELWENATKTSGEESLPNVCLNMLGASAPDWFPSMIPQEALGGGFTSRIIFVVERAKFQSMPRPVVNDKLAILRQRLVDDLRQIAAKTFNGEVFFSEAGWAAWDKYYINQEDNIKKDKWPVQDPIFRGYCNRRALHVRKLAMVFAVARKNFNWLVEPDDLHRAIRVLRNVERKMPRLFSGVGINTYAQVTNAIREYLHMRGKASRKEILNNFASELDAQSIQIVERTLQERGVMKLSYVAATGEVYYNLIEKEEET
jgi:hypothetical protein